MRKGKDMIGKNVVALSTGERVATVNDLVFDHEAARLLALLVDEGGWFRAARVIPLLAVRSFGDDAIVVGSPEDVLAANNLERVPDILNDNATLIGTTLMTTDGKNLGRLADMYFDESSGDVIGYDVTGGLFADLSSGRSFVPAEGKLSLGQDVAFVPPETAAAMEEREPGGLRGALSTAGQNLQETYSNVSDNVRASSANLADATRERQKAFVIGKTAGRDVSGPDGSAIARAGEVITAQHADLAETHGALGSLFASAGGGALQEGLSGARERLQSGYENLSSASRERQREWLLGKTVGRDVIAADGTPIVTNGDTIMEEMIDNAERHGALGQLLTAAGGNMLQEGFENARERVQGGLSGLRTSGDGPQKAWLVGKSVNREVIAPDGTLIVASGAVITPSDADRAQLHGALPALLTAAGADTFDDGARTAHERVTVVAAHTPEPAAVAPVTGANTSASGDTVDGLVGRRVHRDVYGASGSLVAAQGQIVTTRVVERARIAGREDDLIAATSGTAAAGAALSDTGDRLREGLGNAREGAASLLDRAREWVNDTRERAEIEAEERQIRNAVGRPTTRVVLDPQDHVILNVGEIITHKAVEDARRTGVLPILLDSVSDAELRVSAAEVRPDVRGEAALPTEDENTARRAEDANSGAERRP